MNVAGARGFSRKRPLWPAAFSSNESRILPQSCVFHLAPFPSSIAVSSDRGPTCSFPWGCVPPGAARGGQPALLNCISEPPTIALCASTQCQLSFPGFSFSPLPCPAGSPGSAGAAGTEQRSGVGPSAPAPAAGTAAFSSTATDLSNWSKNAQWDTREGSVHNPAGPSLQPWRQGDGPRGGFGAPVVCLVRDPWQQVIPGQVEMLQRGATEWSFKKSILD